MVFEKKFILILECTSQETRNIEIKHHKIYGMRDRCTVVAKVIGNRCYLAKNRDLVWENFQDAVVFDEDVFFIKGINVANSENSGASFGLNRWGLSACNTTVLITKDNPYDLLMEQILRETKTIKEAFAFVRADLKKGSRYQWSNFILATLGGVGVIEIGDGIAVLEQDYNMITRSNHHLLLPTADILRKASAFERDAGGPLSSSQSRRQHASALLQNASSKIDITQIMSAHSEGRGFDSICRHRSGKPNSEPYLGQTAYSYIAEISSTALNGLDCRISAAKGNPCSSLYKEYQLDFDLPSDRKDLVVQSFP